MVRISKEARSSARNKLSNSKANNRDKKKSASKVEKMETLVDTAPRLALGVTPSSAVLARFLRGRKPGSGILPNIPAELVQTIASFLPMPFLGNLRLTCKELEAKTLFHFAKTYFREMHFMHSKYALEALVAMSKSRMAQYVQALALGPPSNDQGVVIFGGQEPKSSLVRQKIVQTLYRYAEENRTMRAFGHDAAMIHEAFQNLSAVTKLEFIAPEQDCVCPFCSPMSSYGERHLLETEGSGNAGFAPMVLDSSQSLGRLLHIALSAAQSAGLQLECVDARTTLYSDDYVEECQKTGYAAYPLTFPCAPPGETLSGFAFAKLAIVKLFLGHHQDICNADRRTQLVERLVTFLKRTPALHTVGLTFQEGHGIFDFLRQLTHSSALSRIKRFEVSNFDFECKELIEVLEPLQAILEALDLSFLETSDPVAMLVWFRDHMTSLTEVDLENVMDYPSPMVYKGNDIETFFDQAIEEWREHEGIYKFDGYGESEDSMEL